MCNFADVTTSNSNEKNFKEAPTNEEHNCPILVEWLVDNFMTLNADKYLLVSGLNTRQCLQKLEIYLPMITSK